MFINRTENQTKSSHIFSSLRRGRFLRQRPATTTKNYMHFQSHMWWRFGRRNGAWRSVIVRPINHGLTVSRAMHSLDGSQPDWIGWQPSSIADFFLLLQKSWATWEMGRKPIDDSHNCTTDPIWDFLLFFVSFLFFYFAFLLPHCRCCRLSPSFGRCLDLWHFKRPSTN